MNDLASLGFRQRKKNGDIYSLDYIEELAEDDEISPEELGFMEGYLED